MHRLPQSTCTWVAESLPRGSVSGVPRGLALSPTGLGPPGVSRGPREGSPLSSSAQHGGKEMKAMKLNEGKWSILPGRKAARAGHHSCDLGDVSQRWCPINLGSSCSKPSVTSQSLQTGNKPQISTGRTRTAALCLAIPTPGPHLYSIQAAITIHTGPRMQQRWHPISISLLLLFCI